MKIQLALGTLSPMKLLLKMLSMQNEELIKTGDWNDERTPEITRSSGAIKCDFHVELSNKTVFIFNSKEEFIGTYNYKE